MTEQVDLRLPERQLAIAVVTLAIEDAYGPAAQHPERENHRSRARRFISSDGTHKFSFDFWAHSAGLDPQAIRERLAVRGPEIARVTAGPSRKTRKAKI